MEIARASDADLDGIMELHAANQPDRGGMLSASLSRAEVATREVEGFVYGGTDYAVLSYVA